MQAIINLSHALWLGEAKPINVSIGRGWLETTQLQTSVLGPWLTLIQGKQQLCLNYKTKCGLGNSLNLSLLSEESLVQKTIPSNT